MESMKKDTKSTDPFEPEAASRTIPTPVEGRVPDLSTEAAPVREAQRQADRVLLAKFAPPGVLVNERLEIMQFRGRTGAFLESPPGPPDANALRMARDGLAVGMRKAFERARAQSVPVSEENLQIETERGRRSIDLEVIPLARLTGAAERFFLILFHERDDEQVGTASRAESADEASRFRGELVASNDYLRALREAELARDYAKGIVEAVTAALVVLDVQFNALSANHAFYDLFRLHPKDVEGRSFFEIGAGSWQAPDVRLKLVEAANGRGFIGFEVVSEFPGIGRKVMCMNGCSIAWAGPPMMLIAIKDITEVRTLEQQRAQLLDLQKQARLEAEQANRAKDLFLATLSHELRTPLTSMLLEAQLLGRKAGEDPKLQRASASIERAARAQARLIDDLMDVSRIVSGKLLLDLRAVDLKEIVQNSVDMATPTADAKSLILELAVPDDFAGTVHGDAIRLQQVMANMIGNAIKFTPRGGRIDVRLERKGEQGEIAISDTGFGIRPDVLPHLFAKFVQADSSVTRAHGGLGLGLAIVRHLVEAHGGQVSAESRGAGMGATFRVTLPLGRGNPAQMERNLGGTARDISGVRVLLVDDSDDTRASASAILEHLGAEVHAVASASAALAALADFRPQVILSDIAMPGEDGYRFIRELRRLPPERGGSVPAAAFTALAGDEDQKRARAAGFQMHVAKPIDAVRLAAAVRTLMAMAPEG